MVILVDGTSTNYAPKSITLANLSLDRQWYGSGKTVSVCDLRHTVGSPHGAKIPDSPLRSYHSMPNALLPQFNSETIDWGIRSIGASCGLARLPGTKQTRPALTSRAGYLVSTTSVVADLLRQRIRTHLELHQLRHVALADAFAMERRAVAGAPPDAA